MLGRRPPEPYLLKPWLGNSLGWVVGSFLLARKERKSCNARAGCVRGTMCAAPLTVANVTSFLCPKTWNHPATCRHMNVALVAISTSRNCTRPEQSRQAAYLPIHEPGLVGCGGSEFQVVGQDQGLGCKLGLFE